MVLPPLCGGRVAAASALLLRRPLLPLLLLLLLLGHPTHALETRKRHRASRLHATSSVSKYDQSGNYGGGAPGERGITARYSGFGQASPLNVGGGINTMMVTSNGQMVVPSGREGSSDNGAKLAAMGGVQPVRADNFGGLSRSIAGGWPTDIYGDNGGMRGNRNWAGTAQTGQFGGRSST